MTRAMKEGWPTFSDDQVAGDQGYEVGWLTFSDDQVAGDQCHGVTREYEVPAVNLQYNKNFNIKLAVR